MTIHDEQDFRAQLGSTLDHFAPGPVPFDAVVRQGRAVMIRKRVTAVAAGLAVLAAAALVPTLLHALQRPPPVVPHYHVTVNPPTQGAAQGLVASGLVNLGRWKLIVRYNARHKETCILSIRGDENCGGGVAPARGLAGAPASINADSNNFARLPKGRAFSVQMVDGYVRDDVDHIRVDLTNGQVLTLHPVPVLGSRYARWIAFAVPFALAVREITVYSVKGELEHTVPFTGTGTIEIIRWLAPGQPALPRPAIGRIGSGTLRGWHWVVRGYIGPWGSCFRSALAPTGICNSQSGALRPGTAVKRLATSYFSQNYIGLSVLQVEPAVSYLLVTRVRGSVLRLRPQTLGGQKYCVLPIDLQNHNVAWTAYDAAGHLLGRGSVNTLLGR